jgi:hypothetical protein
MDCTGSMSSYIESAKKTIMDIVEKIKSSEKADVQFAYIAYRDHHANEEFCTKIYDFTSSSKNMREYISKHGAAGGGDGPEAVTAALFNAVNLPYRKNSIKIVVIIADAPPHGCTPSGDTYPNGDPNGHDPIQIANQMASKGIILYVVACEPTLSGYENAHDLMAGLSKITQGKYLPLTSAHLLPEVIIGGAQEEVALSKLEQEAVTKMEQLKKENPKAKEEDLIVKVASTMAKEGKTVKSSELDDIYGHYDESNINLIENNNENNISDLKEYHKQKKQVIQPQMMQQQQMQYKGGGGGGKESAQSNKVIEKSID